MKCEQVQKMLLDNQWGELTGDAAREVEEHLSGCPRCRRYEAELEEFMSFMSKVEHKEPSERPYLFLRSKVVELGHRERHWSERAVEMFRRPVPAYRAALAALGLVLLSWFGGNLAGRKVERVGAPLGPPTEVIARGAPQHPDTHISFVVTPTVWTRVYHLDTIPSRRGAF